MNLEAEPDPWDETEDSLEDFDESFDEDFEQESEDEWDVSGEQISAPELKAFEEPDIDDEGDEDDAAE